MNDRVDGTSMSAMRAAVAGLLLTMAASGLALAQGTPGGPAAGAPAMAAGGHGMHGGLDLAAGAGMHLSDRLLDAVGATADQKASIHDIMAAARVDLQARHAEAQALRSQMVKLMSAPVVNNALVEPVRQQQLVLHDAVSRRMTQAMVDAANVLTAQQRQQLGERLLKFQDMAERHRKELDSALKPKG
jgi:protein CpxP